METKLTKEENKVCANLQGKFVRFKIGYQTFYGRVVSGQHGTMNVKGIEEFGTHRPGSYNVNFNDLVILPQEMVYKIGKGEVKQPKIRLP